MDRIENTTEVVMDAQVIKMAHELMGSVVDGLDRMEISDEEFVQAIVGISVRSEWITRYSRVTNHFQNRTIGCDQDWDKLADIAMKMSRAVTRSQPMFGLFDEETVMTEKVVKERRKRSTNKNVISHRSSMIFSLLYGTPSTFPFISS